MNQIKKNPKLVRLLGKGTGWEKCPDNDDFEIWGLNGHLYGTKKLDKIFMMDVIDEMPSIISGSWELQDVIDHVNKLNIPLIAPYKYEEIPKSIAFPLQEAEREFGIPYFNNTIAYMICYALLTGVSEMQLWGINQASGTEYFYEKGCVEYWLGIATGLGVKVSIHGKESELLTNKTRYGGNKLYGYNVTYEQIIKSEQKFGETIVKKLLAPKEDGVVMHLGPEKSKGLRTADILGIKNLWTKFANHPEGRWIISLNDAYNIARFAIESKPKRILDLGTGIGASAAILKLASSSSEIVSVEQFKKCVHIAKSLVSSEIQILQRDVELFTLPEIPNVKLSGYKDIPSGKWDFVVIDGPGEWIDENGQLVHHPIAGDIFRILDSLIPDSLVYVDGRHESVNLMQRYLSPAFLKVTHKGTGFTVFQRTSQKYDSSLVVDEILKQLKESHYFDGNV